MSDQKDKAAAPASTASTASNANANAFVCAPERIRWYFRKDGMQSHAVTSGHRAQVMCQDAVNTSILFASSATWVTVFDTMIKRVDRPAYPHLYELIAHGVPCKPYLDMDAPALPPGLASTDEVVYRTQQLVRRVFAEDYGISNVDARLPDEAFVWLHSGNQDKVSLHLIIASVAGPLLAFNSNHQSDPQGARHLARRLAELDPDGVGSMVDQAVYTKDRAMRLMGCSKCSKKQSMLLPLPGRHAFDVATFHKSVITCTAPANELDIIRVPEQLMPAAITRKLERKDYTLPARISDMIVADPHVEIGRITELVQAKVHPSARLVTPRCCIAAASSLVLEMVSATHAAAYNDWMLVGWVLHRARMPLDLWLRFSQRCPAKYDAATCTRTWNAMNDDSCRAKSASFGTLVYWASTEAPSEEAFAEWKKQHQFALHMLPLACVKRRAAHFVYDDSEQCAFGVNHDACVFRGEDVDSPHIVSCYVDDNDDVFACCSHPACSHDGSSARVHRRLGSIRDNELAFSSLQHPVHVTLRFLQAPDHLPSLEAGFLRQTSITDFYGPEAERKAAEEAVDGDATHESERLFGKQLAAWIRGDYKALCIKSPMGTGKSYMLKRLINEHFTGKTVLFVTYRQTLAYEHQRKLESLGFVNYLDVPKNGFALADRAKYPRVICQYDSLRRLSREENMSPYFDLVVLDEAESLLRHSVSPSVRTPQDQHANFEGVVAIARQVMFLDAFLGELTSRFLVNIAISARTVINHFRTVRRTFRVSNNEKDWIQRIIEDLRNGRPVVVASLSTEKIRALLDAIRREIPGLDKNLIIVHTRMQSDAIKKMLVDVDKLWFGKLLVIFSPTIESGCDFSIPHHFHRMYVYVCCMSASPLGVVQMTGRVRHLEEPTVEVLAASNIRLGSNCCAGGKSRVDAALAMAWINWTSSRYYAKYGTQDVLDRRRIVVVRQPDGSMRRLTPTDDNYLLCCAHALADRHNAMSCFMAVFQDLVESAGHTVRMSESLLSAAEAYRCARDGASPSEKKNMLCTTVLPNMPDEVVDCRKRIRDNCASDDDKWIDYKASYLEAFGLSSVDAAFIDRHGSAPSDNKKVILMLRLIYPDFNKTFLTDEDIRVSDRVDALRVKCVEELLAALGLAHPFDTSTIADYWPDDDAAPSLDPPVQFRNVTAFRDYAVTMSLFRGERTNLKIWDRKMVTHTIDTVLKSVGLNIKGHLTRHRKDGKFERSHAYQLDPDDVDDMLHLTSMKVLSSSESETFSRAGLAQVSVLIKGFVNKRYAHLIKKTAQVVDDEEC